MDIPSPSWESDPGTALPLPGIVAVVAILTVAGCGDVDAPPVVGVDMNEFSETNVAIIDATLAGDSLAPPFRWAVAPFPSPEDATAVEEALDWALDVVGVPGLSVSVGPSGSRTTLAVAPVFRDAGVPVIVPNATSDDLREVGPGVFRMVPGNAEQGRFLADFAWDDLEVRSATIFFVNDEYGNELAASVEARFLERGGTVLDRIPLSSESQGASNDYPPLVAQTLLRGTPEVVFIAARAQEVAPLIRELSEARPGIPFLAGDGAFRDDLVLREAPAARESYYRVAFWHPERDRDRSAAYVQAFRERTGRTPGDVDALTYDALCLAAEAIREVGGRPEAVRGYLESLGSERLAFQGVTGPVAFQSGARRNLMMIHVGRDSVMAHVTPASAPGS